MIKQSKHHDLKEGYHIYKNNSTLLRKVLDKGEAIKGSDVRMLHKCLDMSYRDILILLYSHDLYVEEWYELDYQIARLEQKDREEATNEWR
jgi:hypothetical protein